MLKHWEKKLLMGINPVNRVLTKNNSFDPK
jgi:hypothetical protein